MVMALTAHISMIFTVSSIRVTTKVLVQKKIPIEVMLAVPMVVKMRGGRAAVSRMKPMKSSAGNMEPAQARVSSYKSSK